MKSLVTGGNDARQTKAQLIAELAAVRQRVIELEAAETDRAHMPEKAPGLVEEAALRASEMRYRRLFETAQDGILLLDAATGQITDVNPFLVNMLGYSHAEFVGRHLWEVGPFKDVAESKLAFEQLQRDEYIRYEDLPLETRGGQRVAVEFVSNVYQVNSHQVIQCNVRDITARKRAEEVLRESEEKFRNLVRDMQVGVLLQGPQAEILLSNAKALELLGLSEDQLLGKTSFDPDWNVVHEDGSPFPGDTHPVPQAIAARHSIQKVIRGVYRSTTKDRVWLMVDAMPELNDAGAVQQVVCTFIDVTGRKQAESQREAALEALRESEDKFKYVFDNSTVGKSITLPTGEIHVNKAFCQMLGYSTEELQNKRWQEISHPADLDLTQREMTALLSGEKAAARFTKRYLHKNGSVVWTDVSSSVRRDTAGAPQYFMTTLVDITERKRAEQEIESLARFPAENPNPVLRLQPDGVILYANEASQSLLQEWGCAVGEVAPLVWRTAVTATFAERSSQQIDVESVGGVWSFFMTPVVEAGYINLYGRDITERQQMLDEIRTLNVELEQRVIDRTAQLEAANTELETFSYSVSHDLRAPLRGIDGWSLALLEDYGSQLDAQARQYLDRVRSETQRMGHLIDDLLQLSRVTRADMQQTPVDLSALAQTITARLQAAAQPQAAAPTRQFEYIIQPGLTAHGDARLLEIALTNLLDNAAKFTGPRPVARIEFGQTQVDGQPTYFVRDNGVGFDLAYARNLFGAFQRMHRQSEFPGTGIGLATVQRIIHRQGGRVWAEAAVDRGATFYFTLEASA